MSLFEEDVPKYRLVLEVEGESPEALLRGAHRAVQEISGGWTANNHDMGLPGHRISFEYQVLDMTGENGVEQG